MYIPVIYDRKNPLIRENAAVYQINDIGYILNKSVFVYKHHFNRWKNNIASQI